MSLLKTMRASGVIHLEKSRIFSHYFKVVVWNILCILLIIMIICTRCPYCLSYPIFKSLYAHSPCWSRPKCCSESCDSGESKHFQSGNTLYFHRHKDKLQESSYLFSVSSSNKDRVTSIRAWSDLWFVWLCWNSFLFLLKKILIALLKSLFAQLI
jgi:hypothetical protein